MLKSSQILIQQNQVFVVQCIPKVLTSPRPIPFPSTYNFRWNEDLKWFQRGFISKSWPKSPCGVYSTMRPESLHLNPSPPLLHPIITFNEIKIWSNFNEVSFRNLNQNRKISTPYTGCRKSLYPFRSSSLHNFWWNENLKWFQRGFISKSWPKSQNFCSVYRVASYVCKITPKRNKNVILRRVVEQNVIRLQFVILYFSIYTTSPLIPHPIAKLILTYIGHNPKLSFDFHSTLPPTSLTPLLILTSSHKYRSKCKIVIGFSFSPI